MRILLVSLLVIGSAGSAMAQSAAQIRQQQNIVRQDFNVLRTTNQVKRGLTDQLHTDQAAAAKGDSKAAGRLQGDVNAIAKTNAMINSERKMLNADAAKLGTMTSPKRH